MGGGSVGHDWLLQVAAGVVTGAVLAITQRIFALVSKVRVLLETQRDQKDLIDLLFETVAELHSTIATGAAIQPLPPRHRPPHRRE